MKRLKNGFSIMELIIALAIMGGVATIGTVSMTGIQNRSNIKSDRLMGAEIGHAVVARETYSSSPISGVMKYDEVPGINKYINKEYKPESMIDGYFVVTKASIDGMKRVMVGITKNNEEIAENAIYDDGKTPGWVWVQGVEIEQLLGKDVDIGGEGCQHTYISIVTDPTCTEDGYTTHTCSKCGDLQKDSYTTATGHSWNDGITTKEPTATSDGVKTYTCTVCSATKTESIPALEEISYPCECYRCTNRVDNSGDLCEFCSNYNVCNKCGDCSYHYTFCNDCGRCDSSCCNCVKHTCSYSWQITTPATCTKEGVKTKKCECGNTNGTQVIPSTGHSWNEGVVTKEATYQNAGEKTYTCQNGCGNTDTEVIPILGCTHSYSETSRKEATCTTAGKVTYTCSVCKNTYDDVIVAKGHTPGAAATCTKAQTCTACGETLVAVQAHTPGTAATCTTAQICTVCNEILEVAKGHTPGTAATCTTAQICTVCKETLEASKGHTPGTAATCTTGQKCTVCNEILVVAKGHTPGTAATCTTAQTCTVCGETLVVAKGHTPGTAATCTTAQTCTVCGETLVEAKGHSWNKNTGICSTCGAKCVLAKDWASSVNKSSITQISIVDTYTPTGSETVWNGDSGGGLVKVYNTGTKLIIAGSGAGTIYAPSDSFNLFYNFINVTSISGLSILDTSNVTDMTQMFWNCSSLISLNISGFDTSKVTDMNNMFDDCSSLTSLDLSGFDTSKVTDMSGMFSGCSGLKILNLSSFNTSNVTDMHHMFYHCSSLTSLSISGLDTSSVTSMSHMFTGCSSITSLDLSGFDTSSVTNMYNMFHTCSSLISLNLSSFDTSKVTDMSSMFYHTWALRKITLGECFEFATYSVDTSVPAGISKWRTADGTVYDWTRIPNNTAATYYAVEE